MHDNFFSRLACTRNNSGNQGQRPSSCHLLRVAEIDRRMPCTRSVSEDIWGQKTPERAAELGGGRAHNVEARGAFVRNTAEGACPFRPCRGSPGSRALTFGGARPAMFSSAVPCTYVYPEARARQFWLPLIDGDSTFRPSFSS